MSGNSTHNQHIERLWRDVYDVTGLYHELFYFMEQKGNLDPFMFFDLAAVYCVFLPLIKYRLDARRHFNFSQFI